MEPDGRDFSQPRKREWNLNESDWPQWIRSTKARPTPDEERRFQVLRKRRDDAASELHLEPALIAPKATLEALAADPATAAERLLPWQQALLFDA